MRSKLHLRVLSLGIAALAAVDMSGCANLGSYNTKKMLSAAGFHTHAPDTAKQKELYAAAPAYKLERVTYNEKVFYIYKDEKDGIAYVGDQANYHQYEQMALQQRIKQEQFQAVEMQSNLARGWYGAYGPYMGGLHRRR